MGARTEWLGSPNPVGYIRPLQRVLRPNEIFMPTSESWGLTDYAGFVAVIVAAVTGIALVAIEVDKIFSREKREERRREAELNYPADVHILVPAFTQRRVDYAMQDGEEHLLNDIFLPPNATTILEFRLHPRTKFTSTHLTFGCRDDGSVAQISGKPFPVKLVDVYGQGLIEPSTRGEGLPNGHVVNSRLEYRWNRDIKWDGHSSMIVGVEVKTRAEGLYSWFVRLTGEELDHEFQFDMRVEAQAPPQVPPAQMLRCANGDHQDHMIEALFVRIPRPAG